MGKNSTPTKVSGKPKPEKDSPSKESTVPGLPPNKSDLPPTTPGPGPAREHSSPSTMPDSTGSDLMRSLEELKKRLDILHESAAAVQAASFPSHIYSLENQLRERQQIFCEKELLQRFLDDKDIEIKLLKSTITRLNQHMEHLETSQGTALQEAEKERDVAIEEWQSVKRDISELLESHEREKHDMENKMREEMDTQISRLEEKHVRVVSELEDSLEKIKQDLEETKDRLHHAEARNSCATLERTQLMRESERTRRELTVVKERFDRLIFRQDDASLTVQFDQLANELISFVGRFARDFQNTKNNMEKIPMSLIKSNFIPLSTSSCSKVLRISWAISHISRCFLKYLFQPFGQYMNRDDHKRIGHFKAYSRHLCAKDPMKEAIWRNLTLQAMKETGECGIFDTRNSDPGPHVFERDLAREQLFQCELEALVTVLDADPALKNEMTSQFNALVRTAAEIWINARRNLEPVEASLDVSYSESSDWDSRRLEYIGAYSDKSGEENGVSIEDMDEAESEYIDGRNAEDHGRTLRLCLFPKILRVSQGVPIVIHQGIALFEGGLLCTQGEEEVTEDRIQVLELQKLKRKKNFAQGRARSESMARPPSRRASISVNAGPMINSAAATIEFSCNLSNHSTISTTEDDLIEVIGGRSGTLKIAATIAPTEEHEQSE